MSARCINRRLPGVPRIQEARMPDLSKKFRVRLSPTYRSDLQAVCRQQSVAAAKVRRARVLLMSDEGHPDGRRRDWEIAEAVGISTRQVVRIRQQFVREGKTVLIRKPRTAAPGKLDGPVEARLITLCCSTPPDGRDRWTLQLLCDELSRLQIVGSVCPETVRKCLKKTNLNLGRPSASVSRKRTGLDLSRGWKKSSKSIKRRTTRSTR
jgi:Homeodomain-like domain